MYGLILDELATIYSCIDFLSFIHLH
ncbi:hypothetical protein TIFTF001_018201, partial [Ficus carica]